MNYRIAKKIAKRLDGERQSLDGPAIYNKGQIIEAIVGLRRHFLRGCSRRGDYCTRESYFLANRMESVAHRLKFFAWQGRGKKRLYRPNPPGRHFSLLDYVGLPYTKKGKLVPRKGMGISWTT